MNEFEQIESSQRQHFEVLQHQEKMNAIVEQEEFSKFVMMKPKLYKDGDKWCCLYGEDQMSGLVGFGDSPYLAILDWNNAWYKQ
jgi:hypothetical protein